jgi:hypothetical protein
MREVFAGQKAELDALAAEVRPMDSDVAHQPSHRRWPST